MSQAQDGGLLSWVPALPGAAEPQGTEPWPLRSMLHSTETPRVPLPWNEEEEERKQRLRRPGLAVPPGTRPTGALVPTLPQPAARRGAAPGSWASLLVLDSVRGDGAGHRASCEPHSSKPPRDGEEGRN